MIASINPANGETLRVFDPLTDARIEEKLARAEAAYAVHRRTSIADRVRWLTAAAEILESEKDRLGRIMTLEMGKPIGAARAEAAKCATGLPLLRRARRATAGRRSGGRRRRSQPSSAMQPIGPVLAVMPWNFPFWQVFRFAAPALMAGNVGLLKHASNVPQCALEIEDIMRRAGFPDGVFQTLLIGSKAVERDHRRPVA